MGKAATRSFISTSMRILPTFLLIALSPTAIAGRNTSSYSALSNQSYVPQSYNVLSDIVPPAKCPPCFNCMLPVFTCGQFAECNQFDGQCKCPPGWAGIDCLTPRMSFLRMRLFGDGEHRRPRDDNGSCECKDGWDGINCNAGGVIVDDPNIEVGNMTCYKGGEAVFNNHKCVIVLIGIPDRKIIDMLPGRPPQVTFSCDTTQQTCAFQFWVAQKIKCKCVPDRFICGEDGSLVNISDFLKEEIKGPATFSCKTGDGCKFEEPAMNDLIDQVFGDAYITLQCEGGECLHYSQVPGYVTPPKPDNTRWVALSAAGSFTFVLLVFLVLWYTGRTRKGGDFGQIRLPENESAKLMTDHVPASLYFSNITYTLGSRTILDNISGCVKPGQIMAIMGASGAGKSTFLDILARKRKRGAVSGTTLVNGREVSDAEFKKVVGFVDQEDTLMSTLTVYETILYSALLRLPREMSIEAKKFRTLETMNELGYWALRTCGLVKAVRHRSISGGEKRRVSIACELVTSPSILFLDEPTSGLDAYNAFNVVESLVTLARNHNRTVVFTIHQPRSNIVALFDQLVLLAAGKLVYSGEFANFEPRPSESATPNIPSPPSEDNTNLGDAERGLPLAPHSVPLSVRSLISNSQEDNSGEDDTELQPTGSSSPRSSSSNYIKRKTSQIFEAVLNNGVVSFVAKTKHQDAPIAPALTSLVEAYAASAIAAAIKADGEELRREVVRSDNGLAHVAPEGGNGVSNALPDVVLETSMLRGRRRASWGTQFRILSGRAFKNLYRDPALLTAHYTSAIALAVICGMFVHDVTNFLLFAGPFRFLLLSSLGLFANERILFMRERSNGYYSSFTYFSSKIMFDILPLRLVPPLIFGGIVYGLVGLVPTVTAFWKFLLTLVLFNLTTASVVLWLSIAFASVSVASLVGTLIMLFNLLFTGLLINRNSVSPAFRWLHTISFFHAAFEALAVNELRLVIFIFVIQISSCFCIQSFWWPNISLLCIFFVTFTTASFITLHYFVKEKR
ncbi:hypothetical protein BDZ97DRAFT_1784054 [Flammula alnicola]|nr:hypothetical protein BDZ97DRAFT_1784054 [Flammula alnicola]